MFEHVDKPTDREDLIKVLHPYVREWFFSQFKDFALPQLYAVKHIHNRNNILVSAPTGSGKCVTPDTTFLIQKDGQSKLLTGHDLIALSETGEKVMDVDKNGELIDCGNVESYSLDRDAHYAVKKTKAMIYHELYDGDVIQIKTQYGRDVTLTPDHPLLVERENRSEWVKAANLKKGDKIGVPRYIELPEGEANLNVEAAIENVRSKAKCFVDYQEYTFLKNKTKNFTQFDILSNEELEKLRIMCEMKYSDFAEALNLHFSSAHKFFRCRSKYHDEKFQKILGEKARNLNFTENKIVCTNMSDKIFSFTYPKKLTVEMAKWLAFVLAEGSICDYTLGTSLSIYQKNRTAMLKEFLETTKNIFDMSFVQTSAIDYKINSTLFCEFIVALFEICKGRGRVIPIPDMLLNAQKDVKAAFLHVFFSLEAECSKKGISLMQTNKQKIEILNYLLLSFGIISSLSERIKWATNTEQKTRRTYYSITVGKIEDLTVFINEIGIDHPRCEEIIDHVCNGNKSGGHIEKVFYDFKRVRALSYLFENDFEFNKQLSTIYEVVRRTGYITRTALLSLKNKLQSFKSDKHLLKEISYITSILERNICWLKITSIESTHYNGPIVDLTVPDVQNFIGGFGGIYLHNTLTCFLSIINELVTLAEHGNLRDQIYAVYISPLKALNNDIEVNLKRPLEEITEIARKHGKELDIRVAVRSGDTTPYKKSKMLEKPPHILITTPESLAIVLSSAKFRHHLDQIWWCVVDEIHSLAENKRGVHLSLSLERLQQLSNFTRIGLSATVAPLKEIANFLVGMERECKIVDVQFMKDVDLQVMSPVKNLIHTSFSQRQNEMYNLIQKLVEEHTTTIIFTNTRAGTERVVHQLKQRFPDSYVKINETGESEDLIGAHHGSLGKEHRFAIEKKLREGKLKCAVSSTSLELGIDIGSVDLVIMLGSPKSVARALQRVGRAGHSLNKTAKGRFIIMDRDELLECSLILKNAIEKKIDEIHIPQNSLDVLAQQLFGMAVADVCEEDALYNIVKKAYCYRNHTRKDFDNLISYLAGEYASLEDRNVYAKIWRKDGKIGRKSFMGRVIYMTNIGTIPDQTGVRVKCNGAVIGTVDEAFSEKLKKMDIFVLGGKTFCFHHSRGNVINVSSADGKRPTVPSWVSEMLPLSFDLAMSIQHFRFLMEDQFESNMRKQDILDFIRGYLYVDDNAAHSLYEYFKEQYHYAKIPHEKRILIEEYHEEHHTYHIFHSLFGRRVNDVLSRALAFAISKQQKRPVQISVSDHGFTLMCPKPIYPMKALKLLKSEQLYDVMKLALEKTQVLRKRFRHCAGRALMILRQYKGHRKSVGKQQVSSMLLLSAVKRIDDNFPILKEARREVLEDLMDIESAIKVFKLIEEGKIKIDEIRTTVPTPCAFNLMLTGYSDILSMEERVDFVKRMHERVLAKISLKRGHNIREFLEGQSIA